MYFYLPSKGVYSQGANSFLYEYTPFPKGLSVWERKCEVPKVVSLGKKKVTIQLIGVAIANKYLI